MSNMDADERNTTTKLYFDIGLLFEDIVRIMAAEHRVVASLRHLKRTIKGLGLLPRRDYSNLSDVVKFVHDQLQKCGKLNSMDIDGCQRSGT